MEKCEVCSTDELEIIKLTKCGHSLCFKCLCYYLKDFSSAKIECPVEGCTRIIPDYVIRMCLSNKQLGLYDAFCYSPLTFKCIIPGCFYYVSCEKMDGNFTCPVCEQPNCILCNRLHDIDVRCATVKDCDQTEMKIKANEVLLKRKRAEFQEFLKECTLIPNPESFECGICYSFILPRAGYVLRNCLHCFCKVCLYKSFNNPTFLKDLSCLNPDCGKALDSSEIASLLDEDKHFKMIINESVSQFFLCKNGDCEGMWDVTLKKGSLFCQLCGLENCIECQDIHQGKSCEEFRKTSRFDDCYRIQQSLVQYEQVTCFTCKKNLIRNGGCGALYCSNCGNNTCAFTGKIAGKHDIQKCYCFGAESCIKLALYCQCSSKKTCDVRCINGCFPDDS